MYSDLLSKIHFWGWQIIILAAAITLPLGMTSGKEYAELEWPIDIAIALIWVVFGLNMFMTIIKRRERHLYVAIWFYIATFVTVAMLHIVNSFELPIDFMKSYSWYAGVQDALVQWWYGHNAVAFFLTTPYLGLMYYFIPKASGRPIYSYRLSIIHFWALIFIYIWAGPHHLLYNAFARLGTVTRCGLLRDVDCTILGWYAKRSLDIERRLGQSERRCHFEIYGGSHHMLWYGHFRRTDAVIEECKCDRSLYRLDRGSRTRRRIGLERFLNVRLLYYLIPKLYGTKLHSQKLANVHFWIGTMGILFYAIPMYWAGFTQSLMWKQFNPDGTLVYSNFLETVTQIIPMYALRAFGGLLYLSGVFVMVLILLKLHVLANSSLALKLRRHH